MPLKAQRYLKLVGATIERETDHSVEVSVTLNTIPPRSARIWFPIAHFIKDGAGDLFAAEWVIDSRNTMLKKAGDPEGIRVDHTAGLMV